MARRTFYGVDSGVIESSLTNVGGYALAGLVTGQSQKIAIMRQAG
jgi:hypothetical protein